MLRGKDVNDIHEFKRQGLSLKEISALTGFDPKTLRKYLRDSKTPRYGPRQKRPSKLDPFKPYLQQRMAAGVWNATVLLEEIGQQGYTGSYSILRAFLQPLRREASAVAVRRFETAPGQQGQVDWVEVGHIQGPEGRKRLYGFVLTLGYSRAMFADLATDCQMLTFLHLHEAAFQALGGVPQELLYDNVRTVTKGVDARGETDWNPQFADFAGYWGFVPRLCRPYRPQTKGKVESGIGYVRKNFLVRHLGREADLSFTELRAALFAWTRQSANARLHGTTHRIVEEAWQEEKPHLQPLEGRPPYPLVVEQVRRVSRDAYVSWQSNRYSVPWSAAGKEVFVRELDGRLEVVRDQSLLASHPLCPGRHQLITVAAHHQDMPYAAGRRPGRGKVRLSLSTDTPEVEVRSLSVYEALVKEASA
jgi:transposase